MSFTINITGDVHLHMTNGSESNETIYQGKLFMECITQLMNGLAKKEKEKEKKKDTYSSDDEEETEDETYEEETEDEIYEEETEEENEDSMYEKKKKALFLQICNKRKIKYTSVMYNKYLVWAKRNGHKLNRYLKMSAFMNTLKK